jgi:hypothetical protein
VVREKLLNVVTKKQTDLFAANAAHENANTVRREQIRVLEPHPGDSRRVWSVTQIPFVDKVAVRPVDVGRARYFCGCPEISAKDDDGWSRLDFSAAPKNARVALDGDALAAPVADGSGDWLVISQKAGRRHLGSFNEPSRAIVYTTGKDIAPSKWTGGKASPYIELEFAALGPDAEQELTFEIVKLCNCGNMELCKYEHENSHNPIIPKFHNSIIAQSNNPVNPVNPV